MSTDRRYSANRYTAAVVRWIDGDTVELQVDLGQGIYIRDIYDMARINAPEIRKAEGVTAKDLASGLALKRRLEQHYARGTVVEVSTTKGGKFGRYLVEVWILDHKIQQKYNLNEDLIERGLVRKIE